MAKKKIKNLELSINVKITFELTDPNLKKIQKVLKDIKKFAKIEDINNDN